MEEWNSGFCFENRVLVGEVRKLPVTIRDCGGINDGGSSQGNGRGGGGLWSEP